MDELALFAGVGGGLLATKYLLGWRTVCYVEFADYPIKVLAVRIKDGYLDDAPIWDDARTFDGTPWCGCVDIITAGFPCQPFSTAGKRKAGADERNMWPDTIRIIREVRPPFILLENVPGLLAPFRDNDHTVQPAYFGTVLKDLAQSGYDARWRVLSAAEVGAPHKRDRLWIVAHSSKIRCRENKNQHGDDKSCTRTAKIKGWMQQFERMDSTWKDSRTRNRIISRDIRNYDGMANDVDRLKTIGNGQVPAVVTTVWRLLTEE